MSRPRLSTRTVVRKLRSRVWSTHHALEVEQRLPVAARASVESGVRVEPEPVSTFTELAARLARSNDAEHLFLRGLERTRKAAAGTLMVARTSTGALAAAHFVHELADEERLQAVAPGLYPPLESDEALTESVWCAPELRGRGVAAAMLRVSLDWLAQRGRRRAFAFIDVENASSLRAFARAGFRAGTRIRVDRYRLGWRFSRFEPADAEILERWRAAISGT